MQHALRKRKFQKVVSLSFIGICFFLSFIASSQAQESCPKIDSHETVAMKLQLFTAFQTGYDGYEAPCELQCFGKESCQKRCQSRKALQYLSKQMNQMKEKRNIDQCASLTLACLEQCQSLGPQCAQVCDGSSQVGSTKNQ